MKRQKISVFAAAAIVSLIASVACLEWLRSVPPPSQRIPIIVAAIDIREGEKFQLFHQKIVEINREAFMDLMITAGEENIYLGYQMKLDIKPGMPILKSLFKLEH